MTPADLIAKLDEIYDAADDPTETRRLLAALGEEIRAETGATATPATPATPTHPAREYRQPASPPRYRADRPNLASAFDDADAVLRECRRQRSAAQQAGGPKPPWED